MLSNQSVNREKVKPQILRQLMDEIIIVSKAQKMKIELSNEELNNAVTLFLTHSLKLEADEVDQYVKKHNIDLNTLKKTSKVSATVEQDY